jgi:hypothetical protein
VPLPLAINALLRWLHGWRPIIIANIRVVVFPQKRSGNEPLEGLKSFPIPSDRRGIFPKPIMGTNLMRVPNPSTPFNLMVLAYTI